MGYRKTTHRRIPFGRVARALRRLHIPVRPVTAHAAGVSVWRMPLRAAPSTLRAVRAALPRNERQRIARRRSPAERRRATLSLGLQRALLGIALARKSAALRIVRQPHGKPGLATARDRWLPFNASHSGDILVVALGGTRPLGIDIERSDRRAVTRAPARMLTATERAGVRALGEAERPRAFLQLWTRKEAAAKADGRGLALGFATLEAWHRGTVLHPSNGWRTHDLRLGTGCIGSLAIESRQPTKTPPA